MGKNRSSSLRNPIKADLGYDNQVAPKITQSQLGNPIKQDLLTPRPNAEVGALLYDDRSKTTIDPTKYEKYMPYGVYTMDSLDKVRASEQGLGAKLMGFLGQAVVGELIGGTIEGLGAAGDITVGRLADHLNDEEYQFGNFITELGKSIREKTAETVPIYQQNPGESWQWGDTGWWAQNLVSVASGISMLAGGTAVTKGIGFAAKLANVADKVGDVAKYWGEVGVTAGFMRNAEAMRDATDTAQTVKDKSYQALSAMSDEEFEKVKAEQDEVPKDLTRAQFAEALGNKSGWTTYKLNSMNYAFDLFQVAGIFKAVKGRTRTGIISKEVEAAQKSLLNKTSDFKPGVFDKYLAPLSSGFSEAPEEMINYAASQAGERVGTNLGKKSDNVVTKFLEDAVSDKGLESGFFGVLGGKAFNVVGNYMNRMDNRQAVSQKIGEIESRLETARGSSDKIKSIVSEFESGAISKEDAQTQISQEAYKVGFDLGSNAAKVGNVDLLLETLDSKDFRTNVSTVEDGTNNFGDLDGTVFSALKDGALRAEQAHQKVYSKLFYVQQPQHVKQALTDIILSTERDSAHLSEVARTSNEEANRIVPLGTTPEQQNRRLTVERLSTKKAIQTLRSNPELIKYFPNQSRIFKALEALDEQLATADDSRSVPVDDSINAASDALAQAKIASVFSSELDNLADDFLSPERIKSVENAFKAQDKKRSDNRKIKIAEDIQTKIAEGKTAKQIKEEISTENKEEARLVKESLRELREQREPLISRAKNQFNNFAKKLVTSIGDISLVDPEEDTLDTVQQNEDQLNELVSTVTDPEVKVTATNSLPRNDEGTLGYLWSRLNSEILNNTEIRLVKFNINGDQGSYDLADYYLLSRINNTNKEETDKLDKLLSSDIVKLVNEFLTTGAITSTQESTTEILSPTIELDPFITTKTVEPVAKKTRKKKSTPKVVALELPLDESEVTEVLELNDLSAATETTETELNSGVEQLHLSSEPTQIETVIEQVTEVITIASEPEQGYNLNDIEAEEDFGTKTEPVVETNTGTQALAENTFASMYMPSIVNPTVTQLTDNTIVVSDKDTIAIKTINQLRDIINKKGSVSLDLQIVEVDDKFKTDDPNESPIGVFHKGVQIGFINRVSSIEKEIKRLEYEGLTLAATARRINLIETLKIRKAFGTNPKTKVKLEKISAGARNPVTNRQLTPLSKVVSAMKIKPYVVPESGGSLTSSTIEPLNGSGSAYDSKFIRSLYNKDMLYSSSNVFVLVPASPNLTINFNKYNEVQQAIPLFIDANPLASEDISQVVTFMNQLITGLKEGKNPFKDQSMIDIKDSINRITMFRQDIKDKDDNLYSPVFTVHGASNNNKGRIEFLNGEYNEIISIYVAPNDEVRLTKRQWKGTKTKYNNLTEYKEQIGDKIPINGKDVLVLNADNRSIFSQTIKDALSTKRYNLFLEKGREAELEDLILNSDRFGINVKTIESPTGEILSLFGGKMSTANGVDNVTTRLVLDDKVKVKAKPVKTKKSKDAANELPVERKRTDSPVQSISTEIDSIEQNSESQTLDSTFADDVPKSFANSIYRGQEGNPTIDKDGNLVLFPSYDTLFRSSGISFSEQFTLAEGYGGRYSQNPVIIELDEDYVNTIFPLEKNAGTQAYGKRVTGDEYEQRFITDQNIVIPPSKFKVYQREITYDFSQAGTEYLMDQLDIGNYEGDVAEYNRYGEIGQGYSKNDTSMYDAISEELTRRGFVAEDFYLTENNPITLDEETIMERLGVEGEWKKEYWDQYQDLRSALYSKGNPTDPINVVKAVSGGMIDITDRIKQSSDSSPATLPSQEELDDLTDLLTDGLTFKASYNQTNDEVIESNQQQIDNFHRIVGEQIPIELLPYQLMDNGDVVYGVFKDAAVKLSKYSVVGTEYHEAFHSIFNMYFNSIDQFDILEQANKKYVLGEDLISESSRIRVEEHLAEKFRSFMISKEVGTKPTGILDKIEAFFDKLHRMLQNFFGKRDRIDRIFEGAKRGDFRNSARMQYSEVERFGLVNPSALNDSAIRYRMAAYETLMSEKVLTWYDKQGSKLLKQNKQVYLDKLQKDFQIPKAQFELVKDINNPTPERLAIELMANYSYAVEVNRGKTPHLFKEDDYDESYNSEAYSNVTVPGGTNYQENEIATPDITPSIKGHAQFSTDKGIGWFRSDEQTVGGEYIEIPSTLDQYDVPEVQPPTKTSIGGAATKTRRILELQSDLFQKGRNVLNPIEAHDLLIGSYNKIVENIEDYIFPHNDLFVLRSDVPFLNNIFSETKEGIKSRADSAVRLYDLKHAPNNPTGLQFLELLKKDNNWVGFFIKSIVQDSAKKGYEKVLFPSGETAAKVQGHETIANEILKYDALISTATKQIENKGYDYETSEEAKDSKDFMVITKEGLLADIANAETKKQELKSAGIEKLKPIEGFYEVKVKNFLDDLAGGNKDNRKKGVFAIPTITDEYGNTWNEVDIAKLPSQDVIRFSKAQEGQTIPDRFAIFKPEEQAKYIKYSGLLIMRYLEKVDSITPEDIQSGKVLTLKAAVKNSLIRHSATLEADSVAKKTTDYLVGLLESDDNTYWQKSADYVRNSLRVDVSNDDNIDTSALTKQMMDKLWDDTAQTKTSSKATLDFELKRFLMTTEKVEDFKFKVETAWESKTADVPKGEQVKDGIFVNQQGLDKDEQLELFGYLKPHLENQAAKTNKGAAANKMIGLGLRWDYRSNNAYREGINIPDLIDPLGKDKYTYYEQSINNQPLGEITDRIKSLISKASGVDVSAYDGAIINLYDNFTFISAHNDTSESSTALKYPVVAVNIGGVGNFSIESRDGNPLQLRLESGAAYTFGVNGVNRKVFHRTFPSLSDGFLPELTTKIDNKTYSAGSYRLSITLRRVRPLSLELPVAPKITNTVRVKSATSTPQFSYTPNRDNLAELPEVENFSVLYSTLSTQLADSIDIDEMMAKILELSKLNPTFALVYQRLKNNDTYQEKLFTAFNKPKVDSIQLKYQTDKALAMSIPTISYKLTNAMADAVKVVVESYNSGVGKSLITSAKISKFREWNVKVRESLLESDKVKANTKKNILGMLRALGISITKKQLDLALTSIGNRETFAKNEVVSISEVEVAEKLRGAIFKLGEELFNQTLVSDKIKFDEQGRVGAIANFFQEVFLDVKEPSFYNANRELQYSLQKPLFINKFFSGLAQVYSRKTMNKVNAYNTLVDKIQSMLGDDANKYSNWLNSLVSFKDMSLRDNNAQNFKFHWFNGLVDLDTFTGKAYNGVTDFDWSSTKLALFLKEKNYAYYSLPVLSDSGNIGVIKAPIYKGSFNGELLDQSDLRKALTNIIYYDLRKADNARRLLFENKKNTQITNPLSIEDSKVKKEPHWRKDQAMAQASSKAIAKHTVAKSDNYQSSTASYLRAIGGASESFNSSDSVWVFGAGAWSSLESKINGDFESYYKPTIDKAVSSGVTTFNIGKASGIDTLATNYLKSLGFSVESKGDWNSLVKDSNSSELSEEIKDNLLIGYHYQKLDSDNNPILLDESGRPTGKIFQTPSLTYTENGKVRRVSEIIGLDENDNLVFRGDESKLSYGLSIFNNGLYDYKTLTPNKRRLFDKFVTNFAKAEIASSIRTYLPIADDIKKDIEKSDYSNNLDLVSDFILNSFIAQQEISVLFNGISSQYKSVVDHNKRSKQLISPTQYFSTKHRGKTSKYIVIPDVYITPDTLQANSENLAKALIRSNKKYKGLEYNHDNAFSDATKNVLEQKVYDLMSPYLSVNATDGQGFITLDFFENLVKDRGIYGTRMKNLIASLRSGRDYDSKYLKDVLQILKPYYFNNTVNPVTGVMEAVQIKTSVQVLIPGLIKGTVLESLLSVAPSDLAHIYTESAVKDGRKRNSKITLQKLIDIDIDESDLNIQTLDNSQWGLQLDVPEHLKDTTNNLSIQAKKALFSNIANSEVFDIAGDLMTGKELHERIQAVFSEISNRGTDLLVKTMNDPKEVSKIIERYMDDNNLPAHYKDLLRINEAGDNFVIPLSIPAFANKFQSLLIKPFLEKGIRVPVAGGHATLLSDAFITNFININDIDFNAYSKEAADRIRATGSLTLRQSVVSDGKSKYVKTECLLPAWTKKFFKEGDRINLEDLPVEARELLGHRTPLEGKYSFLSLEAVGFLPEGVGSTIVLPAALVAQTGHDFDVDSEYLIFRYLDKDNKPIEYDLSQPLSEWTDKQMNNFIFDSYQTITEHPSQAIEHIVPSTMEEVKQMVRKSKELLGVVEEAENHNSLATQDRLRSVNMMGRSLKGIAVSYSGMVPIAQKLKLVSESPIKVAYDPKKYDLEELKSKFTVEEANGKYIVSHDKFGWNKKDFTDPNGDLISMGLAKTVANVLDIVKEGTLLNLNLFTGSNYMMLRTLGIPLEEASLLLIQPIIIRSFAASQNDIIYQGEAKDPKTLYMETLKTIRGLNNRPYIAFKDIPMASLDLDRMTASVKYFKHERPKKFDKATPAELDRLRDEVIYQLGLLKLWNHITAIGFDYKKVMDGTTPDRTKASSIPELMDDVESYNALGSEELGVKSLYNGKVETVKSVLDNTNAYTSIKTYANNMKKYLDTLSKYFIDLDKTVIDATMVYNSRYSPEVHKKVVEVASFSLLNNKLTPDEIIRITKAEPNTNTKMEFAEFKELSTANKLWFIKYRLKDSITETNILYHLSPKISEGDFNIKSFYEIKFDKPNLSDGLDGFMSESFGALLESNNEFLKDLGEDLIKYNYITQGFAFSGNSFANYIPVKYLEQQGWLDNLKAANAQGLKEFDLDYTTLMNLAGRNGWKDDKLSKINFINKNTLPEDDAFHRINDTNPFVLSYSKKKELGFSPQFYTFVVKDGDTTNIIQTSVSKVEDDYWFTPVNRLSNGYFKTESGNFSLVPSQNTMFSYMNEFTGTPTAPSNDEVTQVLDSERVDNVDTEKVICLKNKPTQ